MSDKNNCNENNKLSILLTILIMIYVLLVVFVVGDIIIQKIYNKSIKIVCQKPLNYREGIYIPKDINKYEKKLADALFDISYNTTLSNCKDYNDLMNPPNLTQQQIIKDENGFIIVRIFYDYDKKHAVIAFSGTFYLDTWGYNLNYSLIPIREINGYTDGIKCHNGFYTIYMKVRNMLWDWWNGAKDKINYLYITGHSLGGALSTLCMYDFVSVDENLKKNLQIIHYSFASPKVGNTIFAKNFNMKVPNSMRINNTEDIITTLPSFKVDYEHVNTNIPFTTAMSSFTQNHLDAYRNLPEFKCLYSNNN